ncbi:MAG: hypothetical protein U9P71_06240 [Campylobacterota bacterium]|nr:hypothetical protein [Campylobacterota bacterium]
MNHKLNVELFLFDASTDYLPHYKNITCKLDEQRSVKDLLKSIQEDLKEFEYPKNKTLVQINSTLIDARLKIKELVKVFGTEITIEPASTFRATKDLRFNDHDFMQKYELLAPYCNEDDLKYYRTLYMTYYSSETLKYNQDYFGDSLFVLAERLLENENENSDAILDLVADEANGMLLYEFENNCYPNIDITHTIDSLKQRLEARKFVNSEQMSDVRTFMSKLKSAFTKETEPTQKTNKSVGLLAGLFNLDKNQESSELEYICNDIMLEKLSTKIQHSFKDFNIAYYLGERADEITCNNADALLKCLGATRIDFSSDSRACGANIITTAQDIAYKKAGAILIDAIDNNADILVVDSQAALSMLDTDILLCEKAVGRELNIQIITPAQLAAIATGTSDKEELGLDKNGSKITFI